MKDPKRISRAGMPVLTQGPLELLNKHVTDTFAAFIRRIEELTATKPQMLLIELDRPSEFNETVKMLTTDDVESFSEAGFLGRERPSKSGLVAIEEIKNSGDNLNPKRYLAKGPSGGRSLGQLFRNIQTPSKHRLADLFEIVRPKTTKDNPTGRVGISEVRPSDIAKNGDLSGASRQIQVSQTTKDSLLDQKIKAGDILFAHRGPIARAAYVTQADVEFP